MLNRLKITIAMVVVAGLLCVLQAKLGKRKTDYDTDLNKIQSDISNAQTKAISSPTEAASDLSYLMYLRASLTGNVEDLSLAKVEIEKTLQTTASSEELYLADANLYLKLHQVHEAGEVLNKLPDLSDNPKAQALKADIAMQEGKYAEAKSSYEANILRRRSWDNIARLAYLKSIFGEVADAEALYAQAEDEISSKEMRSYAWVELQRGFLDLSHGHHEAAMAHYQLAEKAYSGYWLVDEYLAECLGAESRYDEAVSLFEKILERSPRPEVEQALGDLYAYLGKPEEAKGWHNRALAAYLESAQRGEVLYFHHLASFYADVREDGVEAIKWAAKDLGIRQNYAAHDAMAWAFYRAGRFDDSLAEMKLALSSGASEARLFFHAAMIYLAVGLADEGKRFLAKAALVNPHYDGFHLHR